METSISRPKKNKRPEDFINLDQLSDFALVKKRQLLASVVPWSDTTLWRRVRDGSFPAPVRAEGGRLAFWHARTLREWLDAQTHREAA